MHPLQEMIKERAMGRMKGICSVCSANEYVIEAAMQRASVSGEFVLIEATANQVDQFGGYTGMTPFDFRDFVYGIANRTGFPQKKVILGGDHLGPLTWKREKAEHAMQKAEELVRQYVLAGFSKIHLDTSMLLGDDPTDRRPDTDVIAARAARLCLAAENAFSEAGAGNFGEHAGSWGPSVRNACPVRPVYVIGSEVPIPGGSQEEGKGLQVTKASDFKETMAAFKKAFQNCGLEDAWQNVVAVVVQPGVEFGDETIHAYNRARAAKLCKALQDFPGLVFEGHSTDYQTPACLRQMVEDGIAILKVGPALTFALREALFSLNRMEEELYGGKPEVELSRFMAVLDEAMTRRPEYWEKHYRGDESRLRFSRKYSFSDRCRYYLPFPEVKAAVEKLIGNLRQREIPLSLVSQFMPIQYIKVRSGILRNDPEELLKDRIINVLDEYYSAVEA